MSKGLEILFTNLKSKDDSERYNALLTVTKMAEKPVDWFDERIDELYEKLNDENSFQRSIGIMLICDLAKSDSKHIIRMRLSEVLKHFSDEKFITSRQCIQNIWKIVIEDEETKQKCVNALSKYFGKCENVKHSNLLRIDIINSMQKIYEKYGDSKVLKQMNELIESESDEKNKKKLAKINKN
jgi:hypothetical protein